MNLTFIQFCNMRGFILIVLLAPAIQMERSELTEKFGKIFFHPFIDIKLQRNDLPTREDAVQRGEELSNSSMINMIKESVKTIDSSIVDQIEPGCSTNPDNVKLAESLLSLAQWEYLFPIRNPSYSYKRFLQAIGKFPSVCKAYTDSRDSDQICRKTLATIFAHFTQETGLRDPHANPDTWRKTDPEMWRQGLVHLTEMGCEEEGDSCNQYSKACDPKTWQGNAWPCGKIMGKWNKYYGRGAKQLSHNYNYGPFSYAMFGNVTKLLESPSLVASSWLNFASATWFYTYPQPPKPSMLHVIDGTWAPNEKDKKRVLESGFGLTTMVMNGGIECGRETTQAMSRQDYYRKFADYLNVNITGEQLSCANMKAFGRDGAAAIDIYWDRDWSRGYSCKLVNWQTAFSALRLGDYVRCVEERFGVQLV